MCALLEQKLKQGRLLLHCEKTVHRVSGKCIQQACAVINSSEFKKDRKQITLRHLAAESSDSITKFFALLHMVGMDRDLRDCLQRLKTPSECSRNSTLENHARTNLRIRIHLHEEKV